jgi:hypothetical protein
MLVEGARLASKTGASFLGPLRAAWSWLKQTTWSLIKGSSAGVSTIRSAIVVRQRFFGIFWPLFLAGSERLRDNRRMTDAG